jgi:hypothetical protein
MKVIKGVPGDPDVADIADVPVNGTVPFNAELVFPDPLADLAPGARGLRVQDVEAIAELRLEIRIPVVRRHGGARRLRESDVVRNAVRLSMGEGRQDSFAVGHSVLQNEYRRAAPGGSTRGRITR